MFTGIIQAQGKLAKRVAGDGDLRFAIITPEGFMDGVEEGASIAVNGACLTAIHIEPEGFRADVSAATLSATTLGGIEEGAALNLEKSLTLTSVLGGHLVSGHVDAVGVLREREAVGESWRMRFDVPQALSRYIARKGSVCVDGISLTVNDVDDSAFEVNIVPHTLAVTTLGKLEVGGAVNIEVDVLARYLERLMEHKS